MTPEIVRELFDYRDGALYWKVKPSRSVNIGDRAGGALARGYLRIKVYGESRYAHRLIFLWHHGYLPPEIDHINNVRNDNRVENLRAATKQQNARNRKINSANKSGVKGVCWSPMHRKWRAEGYANGRQKNLGYFTVLSDAAVAVRQFRELHHGEFANHGGN